MSVRYQQLLDDCETFLNQPGIVNDYCTKIEKLTGIKRIYIAQGVFGLFVLYMVFGYFAQLVCNAVGFLYPAYKSVTALETSDKEDDVKWLTYWVVFAFFSLFDFFSGWLLAWFPFYWLVKICFLIWCFLPGDRNGSQVIYHSFIRPYFVTKQKSIEKTSQRIRDNIVDAVAELAKQK